MHRIKMHNKKGSIKTKTTRWSLATSKDNLDYLNVVEEIRGR